MDDPVPSWQAKAVVAWSGMRGAGLTRRRARAAADDRRRHELPRPQPDHLPHFGVIFATLVGQGLTLAR
jgi:hypothetical protein